MGVIPVMDDFPIRSKIVATIIENGAVIVTLTLDLLGPKSTEYVLGIAVMTMICFYERSA